MKRHVIASLIFVIAFSVNSVFSEDKPDNLIKNGSLDNYRVIKGMEIPEDWSCGPWYNLEYKDRFFYARHSSAMSDKGTRCASLFSSPDGNEQTQLRSSPLQVIPQKKYAFSFEVKQNSELSGTADIAITLFDKNKKILDGSVGRWVVRNGKIWKSEGAILQGTTQDISAAQGWVKFSCAILIPDNAEWAMVCARGGNTPEKGECWVDDISLTGILEAAANSLQGTGKPEISAQKFENPPVIDGKLNDSCWEKAATAENFVDYKFNKAAKSQTKVKFGYDDNAIYVAFECFESDMKSLVSNSADNDTLSVFWDDCVELFIDPSLSGSPYYHFTTSVSGRKAESMSGDLSWNCQWESAVNKADERWTVEMKIPLNSLEFKSLPGNTWLGNFNRERPRKDKAQTEISSWSFSPGGFNNFEKFGIIRNFNAPFQNHLKLDKEKILFKDNDIALISRSELDKVAQNSILNLEGEIKNSITLNAVKGEWVSTQIIVKAQNDLDGLSLKVSPLELKKGSASSSISGLSWYNAIPPGLGKSIPEMLMPEQVMKLNKGENGTFWIDVWVPENADAGMYRGTWSLMEKGAAKADINIGLMVYDVELPKRLSFQQGLYQVWLNDVAKWYNIDLMGKECEEIWGKIAGMLVKNRMSPASVHPILWRELSWKLGATSPEITAIFDKWAKYFTDNNLNINNIQVGVKDTDFKSFADYWYRHLTEKGLLKYSYVRGPADEATDLKSPGYVFNKEVGEYLASKYPDWRKVQTVPTTDLESLKAYVGITDVWLMEPFHFEKVKDFYAERMKKGESVWWYTNNTWNNIGDEMPRRAFFWLAALNGVTGSNNWALTSWCFDDPKYIYQRFEKLPDSNFKFTPRGCGYDATFFWPGPTGPLESLRLKTHRDGVEDYELYVILRDLLKRDETKHFLSDDMRKNGTDIFRNTVNKFAKSVGNISRNSDDFFTARQQLIRFIEDALKQERAKK